MWNDVARYVLAKLPAGDAVRAIVKVRPAGGYVVQLCADGGLLPGAGHSQAAGCGSDEQAVVACEGTCVQPARVRRARWEVSAAVCFAIRCGQLRNACAAQQRPHVAGEAMGLHKQGTVDAEEAAVCCSSCERNCISGRSYTASVT